MKTVVSRTFVAASLVGAGAFALAAGAGGCSSSSSPPSDGGGSSSSSGGSSSGGSSSGSTSSSSGSSSGTVEAGPPVVDCTFDTTATECTAPTGAQWKLNPYADPTGNNLDYVAPPPDAGTGGTDAAGEGDAGDAEAADAGGVAEAGGGSADAGSSVPTIGVNTTDGQPNPGSLQITATFTNYNQYVEAILPIAPLANFTGRVLTANVRLASVTGATTFPGGVVEYTSTAGSMYCYTPGGSVSSFVTGTWVAVTQDYSVAVGSGCTADPSMVPQLGFHFYANAASGDAGPFPGPITATFEIDTVVVQ